MPDKDGDDEKKSTKSVVNKRQKQMMGEEGYDIARDMGKVRPSKDKKDATTMPVSKEMRKTQKVNKGPSAFERVKAKYGKSVMNVGKKKANEELDLTKVAEAFGGYIVEAESANRKAGSQYKRKSDAAKQTAFAAKMRRIASQEKDMSSRQGQTDARQGGKGATSFDTFDPTDEDPNKPIPGRTPLVPTTKTIGGLKTYTLTPQQLKDNPTGARPPKKVRQPMKSFVKSDDEYAKDRADTERRRKEYGFEKDSKGVYRPSADGVVRFAKKSKSRDQAASGSNEMSKATKDYVGSGKAYKDLMVRAGGRDAKKQKSFSRFIKPQIDAENPTMRFLSPAGSGKPVPKKTVTPTITPEIIGSGETTKSKGGGIGQDTGKVVDTTATEVKPDQLTGSKPRTMPQLMPAEPSMLDRLLDRTRKNRTKTDTKTDTETKLLPPSKKPDLTGLLDPKKKKFPINPQSFRKKTKPETPTQPEGGGGGKKPPTVGTGTGDGGEKKPDAFSSIKKFAKNNPQIAAAGTLAGYDIGKGILSKIMKMRPLAVTGGRVGRRSAGGN